MTNTKTQVLIVGAGPTGLALANYLARLNIQFRIIDKNTERSTQSKALGVQAGTLEAIEHALGLGLVQRMVSAGHVIQNVQFNFYNHPVAVDFSTLPSYYNFLLILAQSETERLLEEYLNQSSISVERNCELISFQENNSLVTATLKNNNGELETVEADFIVGCDGAHSTVRQQLAIPFEGNEYEGNFALADVKLEWSKNTAYLEIFISDKGLLGCFPLKEPGHYRLIVVPKSLANSDKPDISLDEFNVLANGLCPTPLKITEAFWLTRFKVHHRIASQFSKGRAFLAGDAAHIHSPVGGQGMNTGIQDAFNLGFKLAKVLSNKQPLAYLDLYQQQRYPIAEDILRGTDLASRFLFSNNPITRCLKAHLLPKILKLKWVQRTITLAISEIKIARKEIEQ